MLKIIKRVNQLSSGVKAVRRASEKMKKSRMVEPCQKIRVRGWQALLARSSRIEVTRAIHSVRIDLPLKIKLQRRRNKTQVSKKKERALLVTSPVQVRRTVSFSDNVIKTGVPKFSLPNIKKYFE